LCEVFVFLALVVKSSNQVKQSADAECISDCVSGLHGEGNFCQIKCDQRNTNSQEYCFCYQEEDSATVCSINECTIDATAPGTLLDEVECRKLCVTANENALGSCSAYTFTEDGTYPHAGEPVCTIWSSCKEDVLVEFPDQSSGRPCKPDVNCNQLTPKSGPTAVHWTCKQSGATPDFVNPYVGPVRVDTTCSPTSVCDEPTEVAMEDTLVCGPDSTNPESSIGEWKLTKSGGTETTVDLDQDVICNCPLLKVKVEEGSELACTTPLEAGDNYYSLQEPNTCIVVCDGIFATTLTCEKDPKTDGGQHQLVFVLQRRARPSDRQLHQLS